MKSYRELKIWQLGIELSVLIYEFTASFPKHELYGLAGQMQLRQFLFRRTLPRGTRGDRLETYFALFRSLKALWQSWKHSSSLHSSLATGKDRRFNRSLT